MKFKCPYCEYEGEFDKGRTPFFIFSLLDAYLEQKRTVRKHACPKCRTEIILPKNTKDRR